MTRDSGDRSRKIVFLLFVDVVREELCIVIEHHEIAAETHAWRKIDLAPAGPTPARVFFIGVVKVLGVAVSAINNRVTKSDHGGAPITFAHTPVLWIDDAFGKCF